MMNFSAATPKATVFTEIESSICGKGFSISGMDDKRPWGGFFTIDENQALDFVTTFFPGLETKELTGFSKLSPKILLVAPGMRLSWQYHFRRSEVWRVIGGKAGVIVSDTDEQTELQKLSSGDVVELQQGERHRLVGLDTWGVVAEIWKHTDPSHPSDEQDIVRVEDDFGR